MGREEQWGTMLDLGEGDITLDGDGIDLGEGGLDLSDLTLDEVDQEQRELLYQGSDEASDMNFDDVFGDSIAFEGSLFREEDISSICVDYFMHIREVLERMRPPHVQTDDKFELKATDFPYVSSRNLSALGTLIRDKAMEQQKLPKSKRTSPTEMAEEIYDELVMNIPFNVGAYYQTYVNTCANIYDNFLKRTAAASVNIKPKFVNIVDSGRVDEAAFTFLINGYLWSQISVYLRDERIERERPINYSQGGTQYINLSEIGAAMEMYNEYRRTSGEAVITVRDMTVGDLIACVEYTLSQENMMSTLHLSLDEVTGMSNGELLRRYVLLEKEEGLFDTSLLNVSEVFPEVYRRDTPMLERCNVQFPEVDAESANDLVRYISPAYLFLRAPFFRANKNQQPEGYTDSITHELLYYIYLILQNGKSRTMLGEGSWTDYLMTITKFLVSMSIDSPYINPVMYYTPSPIPDSDNCELNFSVNGHYFSADADGFLVTVVGDNSHAYMIPQVKAITLETKEARCTEQDKNITVPPCVIIPLNRLYQDLAETIRTSGQATSKSRLDSSTEYVYTPSMPWVVSHSYSSQQDMDSSIVPEAVSNRVSNPLLNMLMNYTNSFDQSTMDVVPGQVVMQDGKIAMFLREGNKLDTTFVGLIQGEELLAQEGTLGFDEDGSVIMQYFGEHDTDGTTLMLKQGEYEASTLQFEHSKGSGLPKPSDFFEFKEGAEIGSTARRQLVAINRRLCKLSALDYDEELEEVRTIIARDLSFVIPVSKIDAILSTRLVADFEAYVKETGSLELTNFESLKELSKIILGDTSILANRREWSDDCMQVFEDIHKCTSNNIAYMLKLFDLFDINVIALQAVSNSCTANELDMKRYMAAHCIPGMHQRLRDLEERMVLLRILQEIGTDVAPILRRKSPMLTAYTKITTAAKLDDVENLLKSGMKGGRKFDAMPLTRKVLSSEIGGSTPILKYFALERNIHGIMSTAICSDDEQERALYNKLYHCLGLDADGMPDVTQLEEKAFQKAPFAVSIYEACEENRGDLLKLIERGLLADTSARIDIRVIKAFDLFVSYGDALFDIAFDSPECEDFSNVSEYLDDFYTYVGSFCVGFCLVTEDSLNTVDGSMGRVIAFREEPSGFAKSDLLTPLAGYDLFELRGQWGD